MGLNASTLPSKSFVRVPMAAGTYPGRLAGVIDLGLQAQRPFKGEDKPPAQEIGLTYELVDEFMKDEDGQDQLDKPRWLTEMIAFYPLSSEKATSTKRYNVFDPTQVDGGDWVKQINKPVNVTVVLNAKKETVYENIGGISAMRPKDAANLVALKNAPVVFDLEAPTLETWKSVPKFIQDRIKTNLNFKGSKLEALIGGDTTPTKGSPAKAATPDDDKPPY